ncbi:MAG: ATPase domain-containing protein [Spirochaetia bacterium]
MRDETENGLVPSGVPGLDKVLEGGFPAHQLYLVEGASGTGKTTLGLQFLLEGVKRGEKTLLIGTSETEGEILRIAGSHGWSFEGIGMYHHDGVEDRELFEQTVLLPAEVELPRTMEKILETVERERPERLVMDSLTEIRLMAREDYWYWSQLLALKRFFTGKRCTVLLMEIPAPEPFSAIHSIVHGKIELEQVSPGFGPDRRRLRVNKIQGKSFLEGYHDCRIVTGGLICFPRLIAAEHRQRFEAETISTGILRFDEILGGGLDRGTSTLLMGPSGTGKSLFAAQCAAAAVERGEKAAMYIFDERIQTLLQRSSSAGIDLDRSYRDGNIRIRQIDPAELSPGEFSSYVQREIEEGVSLIVIDSLNGYSYAMPDERYLTLYLHELTSYLNQQRVTSIYIVAMRRLLSETNSNIFDISYLSDTVLQHRYVEVEGRLKKALSVFKRRTGPHDTGMYELIITDKGINLGESVSLSQ